ncbi:hypothetical protein EDF31_107249 [Curtobacterium sp. PhB142]|nr:hypothetical protein EDF31_107249 [Curtobacterium sp. PhB142]TCM01075.1 hypothetical protein EDF26_107249 [Curtobacterium sp. PhB134]
MRQFKDRGSWLWALGQAILGCIAAPIAAVALIMIGSQKLAVDVNANGIFLLVLGIIFGICFPLAIWLIIRIVKLKP